MLGQPGRYFGIDKVLQSGCRVRIRAHQLALLVKLNVMEIPQGTTYDRIEASHLCHNENCIKKDHLVAERHSINTARRNCKSERPIKNDRKFCHGHGAGNPSCI